MTGMGLDPFPGDGMFGREPIELARNQLFGQTYASLAISGKSLLIRADRTLYCVGKPE